MNPERFRHRMRVRYHETDQQGIVYHARYLEYLDVAMTEYFRHLGWADFRQLLQEGFDPSLVRTTLHFRRPARFEEEIDIAVWPARVGNSSFTLQYEIRSAADEALLEAETIYVNFDAATRKSRALPAGVSERLQAELPAGTQDRAGAACDARRA
jgi:acyl-CoA thioester hydrolase